LRRLILLTSLCLLLASSLWASRLFIDELKILPGDWSQRGESVSSVREETIRTLVSGDGETLVRAVTENFGQSGNPGTLTFFQRAGLSWKQVGNVIEGTADDPISFLLDISSDGSRVAYRTQNLFQSNVFSNGQFSGDWDATFAATDLSDPDSGCNTVGEPCPGLTWQIVGNPEKNADVLALSVVGDNAYSFYAEVTFPPDLSLSRTWSIAIRMAEPPTEALTNDTVDTQLSVGIACPSGCESTVTDVALLHSGAWQVASVYLGTDIAENSLSITKPMILTLPESLKGAVIEVSTVGFSGGGGNEIQIIDHVDGQAEKVWTYASRNYQPIFGNLTPDGAAVAISSWSLNWNSVGADDCGEGGAPPFAGITEIWKLDSDSIVRKGQPICGELLGLEVFPTIDAAAETVAIGALNLGISFHADSFSVFAFAGGDWDKVFGGGFGLDAFYPALSDDGSVLAVGDQAYSYGGSDAGYGNGTGTYLDAAPGAGRIRRYEQSDGKWSEAGLPLIGSAGEYLTLGYPQGLSADGSRLVTSTRRSPVSGTSARGSLGEVSLAGEREIVIFGQKVVLPDDFPPIRLSSAPERAVTESNQAEETLRQSVRILQWTENTWQQLGKEVAIDHQSAYVNMYTAISADGRLVAVDQNAQCTDSTLTGCANPAPATYEPTGQIFTFTTLTDKIVLGQFYSELTGINWNNDTGWMSDESHCAWYGVLCDANGFVAALSLDQNNLHGDLPDSLGSLRYLRSLDISENALIGSFPTSISQLVDLSHLYASNAGLAGSLGSSVGSLTKLNYVDLSGNRLSGDIAMLTDLDQLRWLDISGNDFVGAFPEDGTWPLAEHINLSSNALSGTLPSGINALPKLGFLNLGGNRITGRLPVTLELLEALEAIDLSENELSGPISESLGTFLSKRQPALEGNAFNCPYPSALLKYFEEAGEECIPPSPPSTPVIVNSESGDGEIILFITIAADGGAAVSTYDAFCTDGESVFTGSSETTRVVVAGLTNDVAYTCRVTASNSAGSSEASSTQTITPEGLQAGLPIWLLYQASEPISAGARADVLQNGVAASQYDTGIFAFDQALNYGACGGGPSPDTGCESIAFEVVDDAHRGPVLEISYLSDQYAGIVIESSVPGLDISAYETGVLKFDIKVVSAGDNTTYKVKLDDYNWGSTGEFDVDADNSGRWVTYSVNMSDLLVNVDGNGQGSNLSLNTLKAVVFLISWGKTEDVVFRLDNVYFQQ